MNKTQKAFICLWLIINGALGTWAVTEYFAAEKMVQIGWGMTACLRTISPTWLNALLLLDFVCYAALIFSALASISNFKTHYARAIQTQGNAVNQSKRETTKTWLIGKHQISWERGLWRLYVFSAAIWIIIILGMLVYSLIAEGGIHHDVYDSILAAHFFLTAILFIYFAIKFSVRFAFWPVIKWIVDGFYR